MNMQAEHYLIAGNDLMSIRRFAEAERAYRAAQNALAPQEPDYLASVKDIQDKIIQSLCARK